MASDDDKDLQKRDKNYKSKKVLEAYRAKNKATEANRTAVDRSYAEPSPKNNYLAKKSYQDRDRAEIASDREYIKEALKTSGPKESSRLKSELKKLKEWEDSKDAFINRQGPGFAKGGKVYKKAKGGKVSPKKGKK